MNKHKKLILAFNIIGFICWCIWGIPALILCLTYSIPTYGFQVLSLIIAFQLLLGGLLYLFLFFNFYKFKKVINKNFLLTILIVPLSILITQIIRFAIMPFEWFSFILTLIVLFLIMLPSLGLLIKLNLPRSSSSKWIIRSSQVICLAISFCKSILLILPILTCIRKS